MVKINGSDTKVTRIRLCGVQGCCPVVEIYHDSNKIIITDDDGGKVKLTKEQWREIFTKANIDIQ